MSSFRAHIPRPHALSPATFPLLPLSTESMHTPHRTCVAFHSSLALVATGGGDGFVRLYDTESAKPTLSLGGCDGRVRRVVLHPSRPLVLGAGDDGVPRVWATDQCDAVFTYDNVHTAAVSAQGGEGVAKGQEPSRREANWG
jgi:WD40 repeat protein